MERRRLILETAEALLGEQGYESATLRAIGERSGIPAASVHHYFSDRLHPPRYRGARCPWQARSCPACSQARHGCRAQTRSPSSWARLAAWARLRTPSLR
ncbi:helix-turn-helix domain-containing protein [Streptomyces yokosukanensis]|uniref:helix-turn-helix domain-containing protein n=1 Tax=Streptomyces TaxID=1883 RepID=UPI002279AAB5|nr:helix-turn-helix domain-containing protein [Streptomyces broussonetiae]